MAIQSRNVIADRHFYEEAAREYCRSLPLEHFMESTPSATQRKITLSSFDLIHAERPDIWCYNELLIQYPIGDIHTIGRVVPDNLVVIHPEPLRGTGSFNTPFEAAKPFLALEYISEGNKRKDYVDNMRRYEQDLRVPYYLLFEPEKKQLLLFKLPVRGKKYVTVEPNRADRLSVPELELEIGWLGDWARFWFRGTLVSLPEDLMERLDQVERENRQLRRQARRAEEQARTEREAREAAEAENARLKAELEALRERRGEA
jgi:Uma2 family endonuclease